MNKCMTVIARLIPMSPSIRSRRTSISVDSLPYPNKPVGRPTYDQLRHIVILTMSDHSYDNYFGMMMGRGGGFDTEPPSYFSASGRDKAKISAFHLASTIQQSAKLNSWQASHLQAEGAN